MPHCESSFFEYLQGLDCSELKVYAMKEGGAVFPREPLLRIEGPLVIGQLLETTLLTLVNFPSLITTNAVRMRLAAGPGKELLEFGLRRAQGPDGGLSASKYAHLGGFDATSNVLAGKLFGIEVKGTHAHAFVMCFSSLAELKTTTIASATDPQIQVEFLSLVLQQKELLGFGDTNLGELAAFISYAQSFPRGFLALVDTYDTMQSGVPNFVSVGLALLELGYKPVGIRLDSGDLAYLSKSARALFRSVDERVGGRCLAEAVFGGATIVASNDIDEDVLLSLRREGNEIDSFGIGTNLVTCSRQPALGCVYKLVQINGHPRIKLSQEVGKLVIPGKKVVYRLFGKDGCMLLDLMQLSDEPPPTVGTKVLCRHPFQEQKRAFVTPSAVEPLLAALFDGTAGGAQVELDLASSRRRCVSQLDQMRADHTRPLNPTPYKVSISERLYEFMHRLWLTEAPIQDLA